MRCFLILPNIKLIGCLFLAVIGGYKYMHILQTYANQLKKLSVCIIIHYLTFWQLCIPTFLHAAISNTYDYYNNNFYKKLTLCCTMGHVWQILKSIIILILSHESGQLWTINWTDCEQSKVWNTIYFDHIRWLHLTIQLEFILRNLSNNNKKDQVIKAKFLLLPLLIYLKILIQ